MNSCKSANHFSPLLSGRTCTQGRTYPEVPALRISCDAHALLDWPDCVFHFTGFPQPGQTVLLSIPAQVSAKQFRTA